MSAAAFAGEVRSGDVAQRRPRARRSTDGSEAAATGSDQEEPALAGHGELTFFVLKMLFEVEVFLLFIVMMVQHDHTTLYTMDTYQWIIIAKYRQCV